jgi:hypothetical protein
MSSFRPVSFPDLGISSSSPNYNTTSTEQLTPSMHTGSKPNLADEHPHPIVASPYASRPTNASPDLAVPGTISSSTYLQSYTASTATPLNDSTNPHPYFRSHMLSDGLPSQQRELPSQPCSILLSQSHSAPDIRLVAAQPSSDYPISNATEARHQQQRQNSRHVVTTDLPSLNSELVLVARSADSATSPSRVYRSAEESMGVWSTIPTSGAHTYDRR